jgi:hypothetical protein
LGSNTLKLGPKLDLARENRSRRKLHASKEKGKEEKETLTVSETLPRIGQKVPTGLSREAPLEGLFRWRRDRADTTLVLKAESC